jgi:hypothetical protein
MIQLLDRLLARWTEAFDELDSIDQYKALVKTYRYASTRNCDLKDFEKGQFPSDEDWLSEKEDLEEGIFNFYSFVREAHDIETDHIQDLFVQLEQIMEENDDPEHDILGADLGRNMLRKTVSILIRTRLHGRLPVSDNFGALAMDNSVEGFSHENIEEILVACGNDAATLSSWKEKGILLRGQPKS